uniref:Uncharacterized protein n=1 Tax=Meloidogyne enterolobii TaxID=390850 RepID=A0A6V7VXL2_MELEN|nr:unnamed protein product [Meloidogyne enterolobii]
MIIVRCCLEQLFTCAFEHAYFCDGVFNLEMINILFDNDKAIPIQFNFQYTTLFANNKTFENVFKFVSNHLSISESLSINLDFNIKEHQKNNLFNILINEGNKFPQIYLWSQV